MTYADIEATTAEGRPYFLYQFVEGETVWRFTSRASNWVSTGTGAASCSVPTPDLMPQAIRWQPGSELPEADLSGVAAAAIGMSGAAVAAMVRAAPGRARAERRGLILDDLMTEIIRREPPLADNLRWQVAVHEAGHAVVGAATGISVQEMLAIGSNGELTRQALASVANTRPEIEAALAVDLTCRATARLLNGEPSGGAGGSRESDLAHATMMATALETSFGLVQSLLWLGAPEEATRLLAGDPALRERVAAHLRRAETRALAILKSNRSLVIEIVTALERTGVLIGDALDALAARISREGAAPDQGASATA